MSIALTTGYPDKICNNIGKTPHFSKQSRLNENELLPNTDRDNGLQIDSSERCRQLRESK